MEKLPLLSSWVLFPSLVKLINRSRSVA